MEISIVIINGPLKKHKPKSNKINVKSGILTINQLQLDSTNYGSHLFVTYFYAPPDVYLTRKRMKIDFIVLHHNYFILINRY